MAKIGKRNYESITIGGKFFTGWYGDIQKSNGHFVNRKNEVAEVDVSHKPQKLVLKYVGYSRGQSAANILFEDTEGYRYQMSLSGFDLMMQILSVPAGKLPEYDVLEFWAAFGGPSSKWYTGYFCQTKQGQNYFIEPWEKS